jgi:hypothetical protein
MLHFPQAMPKRGDYEIQSVDVDYDNLIGCAGDPGEASLAGKFVIPRF